jgi:acetaldehyde dehydrogenase (acetylating)
MITIRYPEHTPQIDAWAEQLQEWVVAYRLEEQPGLSQPEVESNGRQRHIGYAAIQSFFDALKADIDDWRTPRCGV